MIDNNLVDSILWLDIQNFVHFVPVHASLLQKFVKLVSLLNTSRKYARTVLTPENIKAVMEHVHENPSKSLTPSDHPLRFALVDGPTRIVR